MRTLDNRIHTLSVFLKLLLALIVLALSAVVASAQEPLAFAWPEQDWDIALPSSGIEVFTTSYNAEIRQTDGSPCTGASGRDLCQAAREGDRTIAVSRDLLWFNGGPFRWHDKVKLASDVPQCDGLVLSVEDTMAARFMNRADLFYLAREDNTSCRATLSKL